MNKRLIFICLSASCALLPASLLAQKVLPKILSATAPAYPQELTDTGTDGVAEVDVLIKADGSIGSIDLGMASQRPFGKALKEVVAAWKFQAGTMNGVPTEMEVTVPFRFVAPFDQRLNAIAGHKVFVDPVPGPVVSEKEFPSRKVKIKKFPADPQIPRSLLSKKIDETVKVKIIITPDGGVINPVAQESKFEELGPIAVQYVVGVRFEPCIVDGKPAYVEATAKVPFLSPSLRRGGGGDFGGGEGGGGGRRGGSPGSAVGGGGD